MVFRSALAPALSLALTLACGCLDTASLQNDQGASAEVGLASTPNQPNGAGNPSPAPGGDGDSSAAMGDGDSSAATGDGDSSAAMGDGDSSAATGDGDSSAAMGDGDSSAPMGDGDSSAPMGDGDGPVLMPELVAGTAPAAGCLSYTQAQGEMCGSYFCGVDGPTLEKGLDPDGVCGENNGNLGGIDFVCEGRLVSVVGACARQEKAANLLATNEQLRPLVQACVYQDAEIKQNVTEQCLSCFIDVADCAGTYCLIECVAGDNEACDQCRMNNNCEQPLFGCAGFPNPL